MNFVDLLKNLPFPNTHYASVEYIVPRDFAYEQLSSIAKSGIRKRHPL